MELHVPPECAGFAEPGGDPGSGPGRHPVRLPLPRPGLQLQLRAGKAHPLQADRPAFLPRPRHAPAPGTQSRPPPSELRPDRLRVLESGGLQRADPLTVAVVDQQHLWHRSNLSTAAVQCCTCMERAITARAGTRMRARATACSLLQQTFSSATIHLDRPVQRTSVLSGVHICCEGGK